MESISPQSLLEFVYRDSDVVQYLQQTDLALGQSTNVALTRQQAIPTIYRVSHRGCEHESISEHGTIGEHGGECWWLPATDRNPRCGRRLSTRQGFVCRCDVLEYKIRVRGRGRGRGLSTRKRGTPHGTVTIDEMDLLLCGLYLI